MGPARPSPSEDKAVSVQTLCLEWCNDGKSGVFVPRDSCHEFHKAGGSRQQKCVFSQFWRPEV